MKYIITAQEEKSQSILFQVSHFAYLTNNLRYIK